MKTITMDFDLYQKELNERYYCGYNSGGKEMCKIITDCLVNHLTFEEACSKHELWDEPRWRQSVKELFDSCGLRMGDPINEN